MTWPVIFAAWGATASATAFSMASKSVIAGLTITAAVWTPLLLGLRELDRKAHGPRAERLTNVDDNGPP